MCVELNGYFYVRDVNFVLDIKVVLILTFSVKMKNKEFKIFLIFVYFDVFFCSKSVWTMFLLVVFNVRVVKFV